tara:strand:- start:272 stop:652 length:381 start_codon:yes stop_codon:yes gene_type:complete
MEHPNKKQRENQAKLLAQLPEEEREEHARLLRFGNAAYIYHRQAEELEPTEADFEEWLEGLPKNVRRDMEMQGFELCKGVLSFSRYVNEKNDIGMGEWMKKHLSAEDYKAYYEITEERKDGADTEV